MMAITVSQLINRKGSQVWSIRPSATVFEALELMAEKRIGALLVMQGPLLVGIFSERDYARKVILHGKSSRDTRVREVMTPNVIGVRPEQTMADCMALMTDKRVRHLPVLEDDEIAGVISIGDVVKEIISEQEFIIGQLENYITGSR
jgi:CBS domain-containing protein